MRSGSRSKVDAESMELRDLQKSSAMMHVDELEIDEVIVRRLLAEQFPEWADWPLTRVEPGGWSQNLRS